MEDIHELHEHAEHAREDSSLKPATFSMAVLAVLVALVTLLGHRAHTEELLLQNKATDTWAEYQAKNIRQNTSNLMNQLLAVMSVKDAAKANKTSEQLRQQSDKYAQDKDKLQAEARKLEAEVHVQQNRANRFDLGEALLEVALVITSITLLTRRKGFWYFGLLMGIAGLIAALTGLLPVKI